MIIPKYLTLQSKIYGIFLNYLYDVMVLFCMIGINNPRLSEMNRTLNPMDFEQTYDYNLS